MSNRYVPVFRMLLFLRPCHSICEQETTDSISVTKRVLNVALISTFLFTILDRLPSVRIKQSVKVIAHPAYDKSLLPSNSTRAIVAKQIICRTLSPTLCTFENLFENFLSLLGVKGRISFLITVAVVVVKMLSGLLLQEYRYKEMSIRPCENQSS